MTDRSSHPEQLLGRALAPAALTPALAASLRRLADDLDRIAAGTAPTPLDLHDAPLLVDWRFAISWSGLCLTGFAAGHPLLGSRKIASSHLWALDPQRRWARTFSRFYRLGLPEGGAIPRDGGPLRGDAGP